ncbi:uncharacterized protein [Drosophila kikkawai]|uniref:Uncharacterized protein n=1 Tax=Drosophila kikkawai TaxID=30033 RepID=A0A6P4IE26_DROKI|nr:uncharacterized protein LOC108073822 [Drosophila kikkawai]
METINFNEFTPKERYEIIKAFLVKMQGANSVPSQDWHVQKFFKHYLRKFYKVPAKLVNDIAYCQRAMKSHLVAHQTIVDAFGQQEDAAKIKIKNNYLHELEEILYQLNAECQYLVLRLQDDIDRFCLAFTEHDLKPDELVITDIVSQSIVPLIVDPEVSIKPYFVVERPTEDQLLRKYFVMDNPGEESLKPVVAPEPPQPLPLVSPANVVTASRLNLQAALQRARSQNKPAEKMPENDQPKRTKELFLQSVGLCTHKEYQQLKLSMIQIQKRKLKPSEKTK